MRQFNFLKLIILLYLLYFMSLGKSSAATELVFTDEMFLAKKVEELVEESLKRKEMQSYFDSITSIKEANEEEEAKQQLDKMAFNIGEKFLEVEKGLKVLQKAATDMYAEMHEEKSRQSRPLMCCEGQGLVYEAKFKSAVNVTKVCSEVAPSLEVILLPTALFERACLKNRKEVPMLTWQYFGNEEGLLLLYPARAWKSCSSYDCRLSSWYAHASVSTPKRVVIVIDKSSSMKNEYNGVSLMTLAKEAAKSVIGTLNSQDKFGVIAFSNVPESLQSFEGDNLCFMNLAQATPQNKLQVQKFFDTVEAQGGTIYWKALLKAFEFLKKDYVPNSGTPLARVILFMSDGSPEDSPGTIFNKLRRSQEELNNSVVLMTYGIGDADFSILEEMAVLNPDVSKKGKFTKITEPSTLRNQMAQFYEFFAENERNSTRVVWSKPYVDTLGIGQVMTISMPVYHEERRVGVVGTDATLRSLVSQSNYYKSDELSYSFVIDGQGATINHPLFPSQNENYTYFVAAPAFERDPEFLTIFESMKRGEEGATTFVSSHYISRGESYKYGTEIKRVLSTYRWKKIPYQSYSQCLVHSKNRTGLVFAENIKLKPGSFLFHRFDVKIPKQTCSHFNLLAAKNESSVFFAFRSFELPEQHLHDKLTGLDVQQISRCVEGTGLICDRIKESAKRDARATHHAQILWTNASEKTNPQMHTLWRYIGTQNGVFRVFPGIQMPFECDPTETLWYQNSIANRDSYVVSTPYRDRASGHTVITLSHALFKRRKKKNVANKWTSEIMGVIAMDLHLTNFYDLFLSMYSHCSETKGYECYLLDIGGYVILAKGFINDDLNGNIPSPNRTHLTEIEPQIGRSLILAGIMIRINCSRMDRATIRRLYKISLLKDKHEVTYKADSYNCLRYQMISVPQTNSFLLIRTSFIVACGSLYVDNNPSCSCNLSQCNGAWAERQCECPCETLNFEYKPCENKYYIDRFTPSPCPPMNSPVAQQLFHVSSTMALSQCSEMQFTSLFEESQLDTGVLTSIILLVAVGFPLICALLFLLCCKANSAESLFKKEKVAPQESEKEIKEVTTATKERIVKRMHKNQKRSRRITRSSLVASNFRGGRNSKFQQRKILSRRYLSVDGMIADDRNNDLILRVEDIDDCAPINQQSSSDAEISEDKGSDPTRTDSGLSSSTSKKDSFTSKSINDHGKLQFKKIWQKPNRISSRISQRSSFRKAGKLFYNKAKSISATLLINRDENEVHLTSSSDSSILPPKPKYNNFWR